MTRRRRILVELLGPALVATLLCAFVGIVRDPGIPDRTQLKGLVALLAFAYMFAGLPSIIFTVAMEVAFAKGLSPGSWLTVLLAAGLGLLSGMGIVGFDPRLGAFDGMAIIGLATGALLGLLVKAGSRQATGVVGPRVDPRFSSPPDGS